MRKMMVEVYGGTCISSCDTCAGGCSSGSSGPRLEKEVELLAYQLKNHYSDNVEVKYIDTDRIGLRDFPKVSRAARAGYVFPIIAVNGELRLAGGINVDSVREILDETSG